jgi:uncharacterized protein (TIGR02266 family)
MPVDLKTRDQSFAATSKNLGVGGVFVATDRQLEIGERVTVELSLPDHVRPVPVAAEVRWLQTSDDRPLGMGLRFVNPSFGLTVAIHELLRSGTGPRPAIRVVRT